jgi:hypothetical protein
MNKAGVLAVAAGEKRFNRRQRRERRWILLNSVCSVNSCEEVTSVEGRGKRNAIQQEQTEITEIDFEENSVSSVNSCSILFWKVSNGQHNSFNQ